MFLQKNKKEKQKRAYLQRNWEKEREDRPSYFTFIVTIVRVLTYGTTADAKVIVNDFCVDIFKASAANSSDV